MSEQVTLRDFNAQADLFGGTISRRAAALLHERQARIREEDGA